MGGSDPVSEKVLDGAFVVANGLDSWFVEYADENALLTQAELSPVQQSGFKGWAGDMRMGQSTADLLVGRKAVPEFW